ncbi:MAG: ArsB/NhaD family transporter [Elusimicrobiota bacterium]
MNGFGLTLIHLSWIPILIFAAAYFLIALENGPGIHLDRTATAYCGAVAMIMTGALSLQQAYRCVDWNTILFLLGIMILAAHFRISGFFDWTAERISTVARTRADLLILVVFVSGLLSAFFVNDTICLVFAPIILQATEKFDIPKTPYLLALATASNIGSAMSVTGNPQNALIGITAHFSFMDFLIHLAPVSLAGLFIDAFILAVIFRKEIFGFADLSAKAGNSSIRIDRSLLIKSALSAGIVSAFWIAGFSFPLAAAAIGAFILIVGRVKTEKISALIDWELLLFFASLFIIMRGVETSGALSLIINAFTIGVKRGAAGRILAISGAMLALSNLVSNVPAIMLARPVIAAAAHNRFLWLAAAASSTLAGNMTPISSVANLIVLRQSGKKSKIGFWEFTRVGTVVTMATLASAVGILYLESLRMRP